MPEDRDSLANLIAANKSYEQKFDKSDLDAKPVKRISILTCMDCRMNPYEFAGLKQGEAHIIRNAGGRATDDAIRSLIISHKFLGTLDWFVIHHTQCGMATFERRNYW
jgi:carbonic anhydrase